MNNICAVSAYPGAKVFLARDISRLLYRKGVEFYLEPYSGMWNVGLQSAKFPCEIYNDLDPELVALFKVLCDEDMGKQLHHELLSVPYCEDSFLNAKRLHKTETDPMKKALYTWVALLMSLNGWRQQFRGFHTGKERKAYQNMVVTKRILLERLKGIEVYNEDALGLLRRLNSPKVAAYLDPPYYFSPTARTGGKLYANDYTTADQNTFLKGICDLKCRMLVSGYRNELYDEVLCKENGWYTYDLRVVTKFIKVVQRGEHKPTAIECLWSNYDLVDVGGGYR